MGRKAGGGCGLVCRARAERRALSVMVWLSWEAIWMKSIVGWRWGYMAGGLSSGTVAAGEAVHAS